MSKQRFKILVVDDEAETREVLVDALGASDDVMQAADGQEAFDVAVREMPDLIILDVNMPGRDGFWACKELRSDSRTKHVPVLILSSRSELEQKLEAYNVGADDYLEKPFTMPELKAKVAAKLRRLEEKTPKELRYGNLVLHAERMEVVAGAGAPESLSVLENRLLTFFLQNPERVLTRDEILTHVWKNVAVSSRTVDAHIVSLRRKIQDFDHEIATIYGAGYAVRRKAASPV